MLPWIPFSSNGSAAMPLEFQNRVSLLVQATLPYCIRTAACTRVFSATSRSKMPTWKLRASFRDHTLGVQALSYLRGTLLSAGFDWDIVAWDAERLEKIGTMTGHKAPVTAVAQVMVVETSRDKMTFLTEANCARSRKATRRTERHNSMCIAEATRPSHPPHPVSGIYPAIVEL